MIEKLPPIVRVKWKDAWSSAGRWTDEEIAKEPDVILHSVGFLIRSDKRGVYLAGERDPKKPDSKHIQHIPRSCVLEIKKIENDRFEK